MSKIPKSTGTSSSRKGVPSFSEYKNQQVVSPTLTSGEQFYEFLTSVGYQPPSKHLKPEHFEYLFRDHKTAALINRLMKKGKREHALAPEEVLRYETLKVDGMALYGVHLENAVDKRSREEKKKFEENHRRTAETEEIQRIITKGVDEMTSIQNESKVIGLMIAEIKKSKTSGQKIMSQLQRESQDLDIQMEVTHKRLNDKTVKLSQMKKHIRQHFFEGNLNNPRALNLNWDEVIQKDDYLIKIINPLITNHAAELIVQAGPNETDDGTQFGNDKIQQILIQYAEHFERLKHCIIYEKVRGAELEIKLAGEMGAYNMLKSREEHSDTFGKNLRDIDNSIYSLQDVFKRENECAIETIRGNKFQEIERSFETLINLKTHAKKRLNSFFDRVFKILVRQKLRTDILRYILLAEMKKCHNMVERLREHSQKAHLLTIESEILDGKFNTSSLTNEGQALLALLNQHEFPSSILQSTSSTYNALIKIYCSIDQTNWNDSQKESAEYSQCVKNMIDQHHKLIQLYESLSDKYSISSKEKRRVTKLEASHVTAQSLLNSMQENKYRVIEENIFEKQSLVEKMKAALAADN